MAAPGTQRFPELAVTPSAPPAGYALIYMKTDNILYILDSNGIEYPIGSSNIITGLTGDVSATGPGTVAATVNSVGGQSASNIAASVVAYMAATSANTALTLVERDSSGNFSAGTITAALTGNVSGSSASFTGSLTGDVTGTQGATVVVAIQGSSVSNVTPTDAQILIYNTSSSKWIAQSVSAEATINHSGVVTLSTTAVTGKLLTGYSIGSNTPIAATDSVLSAFEKLQGQVSASVGAAITALTGDVTATGPGSVAATVAAIQGTTVSGTTGTGNVVFSAAPTLTGLLTGGSASFSSTIAASNFSGSSSGTNTGDVTKTNTNSILISLTGQNISANLQLSTDTADAGYILANTSIHSGINPGLLVEVAFGTPVNIGTTNVAGSASSFSLTDHVHAHGNQTSQTLHAVATDSLNGFMSAADKTILDAATALNTASTIVERDASGNFAASVITASLTGNVTGNVSGSSATFTGSLSGDVTGTQSATAISATTVTGKLLTDYTVGANTPIAATDSILSAFEKIQGQLNATVGAAITSLSDDVVATGPGAVSATIQANVVSNAKLAQMNTLTLKGNNTGGTANALDLTVTQVNAMLGTVTTVGTYNGGTANATGATITSPNIFFQSASASFPGMVDITTQTFAGNKTFSGQTAISNTSTTALAINSTSFIFDATNNALGIGIAPSSVSFIDAINSSAASKTLQLTGYGTGSTVGTRGRFARGTIGSPTAVQTGDIINFWSARGYGASQFATASTAAINAIAGENFTNTSNLTYLAFNTTPTGSVTSAEAMRVASTGVTLGPQSTSTALHQINGGVQYTTRTITASTFTIDTTTTDYFIYTDSTSNTIAITLEAVVNGRELLIQDKTGKAGTNAITVTPASGTINGLASYTINQNYGAVRLTTDGTNWFIAGSVPSVASQTLPVVVISASAIDWSLGTSFTKTLSANTTFTFSNQIAGETIVVRLTNTASNYTVTWPSVKWPAGTAPTMSTGAVSDVYSFFYDGSNTYGSYIQNMS